MIGILIWSCSFIISSLAVLAAFRPLWDREPSFSEIQEWLTIPQSVSKNRLHDE